MAIPHAEEIKSLATKYTKQQLQQMAQMGEIDSRDAVLAGMMIDRIVQANIKPPTTTVAQDVMQPIAMASLPAAQQAVPQPAQMGAPTPTPMASPESAMMAEGGLASLPVPDSLYDDSYAGGGVVAFSNGDTVRDPYRYRPFSSAYTPISAEQAEEERKAREAGLLESLKYTGRRIFGPLFTGERLQDVVKKPTGTNAVQPVAAPKPDAVIPSNANAPAASADKSLVTREGASVIPGQGFRLPAPPTNSSLDIVKGFLEGEPDVGSGERKSGYFQRSEDREKRLMDALGKDRLQGQAFGEYEKMLKKESEQAGLDKDQAKYMSLLKAGLSMMAGTSQHALVNIGKGALLGAEDYQAAYKDLRKAERQRTKEFALIEQARRAEQRDDLNRRDQLLMRASDAAQKRDDFGVQALMNAGIDDSRAARDIWKTQYAGGVQLGAAQIRANALASRGTGGISEYQMSQIRRDAMAEITPDAVRAQIAKQLKLNKPPVLGADKSFDDRVNKAYEKAINDYVQRRLGGTAAEGLSQRYSLVGTED